MSMKYYIDRFDKDIVEEKVSLKGDITRRAKAKPERPMFFPDAPGGKVIINLWATRERLRRAIGVKKDELVDTLARAVESPSEPKEIDEPPALENCAQEPDLTNLPIPQYYPRDGGRYITSGVVFAEHEGTRNLSIHRLMVMDEKRMAIRLVPRDLHKMYEESREKGKELDIAIAVGVCPPILLASATSLDFDTDELKLASSLRESGIGEPVEVTELENGLTVPAHSEYILQGRITLDETDEGPFVDITGTYDKVRKQPIVEIDKIWHTDDPIFHALLPGGYEHFLLMGLPRESVMKEEVEKVAKVKDVRLTEGGCSWLHGIISIEKEDEGEPKKVIEKAFQAHTSMKKITVVDEDINIYDDKDVEWAVATRFQPHRDLTVLEDEKGSSLDPSAPDLTSKWGLDATKPGEGEEFEKASLE